MKKEIENEVQHGEIDVNIMFEMFRKHLGWIIALLTSLTAVFMAFFRFLDYIKNLRISGYYGFDVSFCNTLIPFSIFRSIFGASFFYFIVFIWYKKEKTKLFSLNNFVFYIVSIVFNCILCVYYYLTFKILTFIICAHILLLFELLFFCIYSRYKERNIDSKIDFAVDKLFSGFGDRLLMILMYFSFVVVIFSVYVLFVTDSNLKSQKSYSKIDESRVIVHATSEYYVVLDCEIEDKVLKLHQGKYEIIPVANVHSEKVKFNDVQMD